MNQTTTLVSIEFLSWIKDRLKEEADRKEQEARTRTASRVVARMRSGVMLGLTLMATMASSIF